jgi:cell wall assembly regulator SMI1
MRNPAEPAAINAAELALGVTFPEALRLLYLASDGVFDDPGQWFVIWPLADMITRNQAAWKDGNRTRRGLLAFGDDGTGSPFCVRTDGRDEVLFFGPIECTTVWLAPSLPLFWEAWMAGSLPPH